jgi:hypothetical protein
VRIERSTQAGGDGSASASEPSTAVRYPRARGRRTLVGLLIVAAAAAAMLLLPGAAVSANPSANLDQCANGPAPSPSSDGCNASATDWVNGNLGASKASYFEGDSIPYRMRFDNLSLSPGHTVTIEWDTTKSGKHALDYIDDYNESVLNANPCLGVSGCTGSPNLFAIPADPQVTGAGVTPNAGSFAMWGGTITAVSAYSYPNGTGFTGDKSARLTITFTATSANPVLAWGGHIATRKDWGANNSAVSIPGSPYHTRLINLDGSGGNQDRSLSADAVIFPASITIVKDTVPNDSTLFSFTDTGGLVPASFMLKDDGTNVGNSQSFNNIINFTTYTFTEALASHYALSFPTPVCTVTSPNGGSQTPNLGTRTVSINLAEGENVTCTFVNTHSTNNPTISTTLSKSTGNIGDSVSDSSTLSGATSDAGGTVTYKVYSDNTCSTLFASAGTKTVTNGVVPDSDGVQFNQAGDFYWQASYSGDANNNPATSTCTSEHLVIAKNSPSISTTLSASTINVGDKAHDSSTLSGATATAGGTVTYKVYTDNTCSTLFASAGTKTVTNGSVPNSDDVTFNSAGTFYWQAVYSGDANNNGATSACTSEQLVVNNPNVSQITPTGTTCQQFRDHQATTLGFLQYSTKGNPPVINQVNPGVFFYWVKVSGPGPYTITQSVTPTLKLFAMASGSFAYDANCNKVNVTLTQAADGSVTVPALSGTGPFFIGIKYDATTVTGQQVPGKPTFTYTFQTTNVGGSTQQIKLQPK